MPKIQHARELLEENGFKILSPIPTYPAGHVFGKPRGPIHTGLILDCETSGWNADISKILNLALIQFEYSPISGKIFRIIDEFVGYEDPKEDIPEIITYLTGISKETVAGKSFNDELVHSLVTTSDLVIAHNSKFDRVQVENRFPVFKEANWGCSMSQIDWRDVEAVSSQTLSYLIMLYGYYYSAHQALSDCQALLLLLQQETTRTKRNVMRVLAKAAEESTAIVWAHGSPFEMKDDLRMEGYKWFPAENGGKKAWRKFVAPDEVEFELDWLNSHVYGRRSLAEVTYITAKDRFSIRE